MDTPNLPSTASHAIATGGLRWQPPSFVKEATTSRFDENGNYAPIRYWESVTPTPGAIDAAKRWLGEMASLIDRARAEAVEQWVIGLALQTAGKGMSDADAKAKAMAYVSTLCDEPAHSFTAATLKAAARKFTWFPSVAEIADFLAKETADRRAQTDVARRLASSSPVENAEARYRKPPARVPPDAELRRRLSWERVRRFGRIPESGEVWRQQMQACADALGVKSPWSES